MAQVKQQASAKVNEQKERAAAGLGTVASAVRQASEHLRSENQTLAAYADTAVDQIQHFADRMRDKDPGELGRDLERFARQRPAAFLGGAFVLGLGLARFLKSSGTPSGDYDNDADYLGSGYTPGPSSSSLSLPSDLSRSDDLARTDDLSRGDPSRPGASTFGNDISRPDDLSRPGSGLAPDPTDITR